MIKIPLTQGQFAFIDNEDFSLVSQYKWCANRNSYKGKFHSFYAYTSIREEKKWKILGMHRLILKLQPKQEADHIDKNGLNNTRANLRICTRSLNNANRCSIRGTSKFRGVHWSKDRKKWCASITVNKKVIKLGRFDNEIEAAHLYDIKAREFFGEFANTNFSLSATKP